MIPKMFKTAEEVGRAVATKIAEAYQEKGKLVLGVPWGTTPIPIFDSFAELVKKSNIDLLQLQIVVMDEYVQKNSSGYAYVNAALPYSGHHHLQVGLLDKLSKEQAHQLKNNIHFPDANNPEGFDRFIQQKLGGVDIFIVASGAEDGHVAMCGPGSSLESQTGILQIPQGVRDYNFIKMRQYFGNDKNKVPSHGVSVGLGTIINSKRLLFVAHGSSKSHIVEVFYRAGSFDKKFPITFLWAAAGKSEIYLDAAAARRIKR